MSILDQGFYKHALVQAGFVAELLEHLPMLEGESNTC